SSVARSGRGAKRDSPPEARPSSPRMRGAMCTWAASAAANAGPSSWPTEPPTLSAISPHHSFIPVVLRFPDDGPSRRFVGTGPARPAGPHGLAARPPDPRDGPGESSARPHPCPRGGDERATSVRGPRLLHAKGRDGPSLLHALPGGCRALRIPPRGRHGRRRVG